LDFRQYRQFPDDDAVTGLQADFDQLHYRVDWVGPVPTNGDDTVIVTGFSPECQNPRIIATLNEQLHNCADDKYFHIFLQEI
jgi:hypothetical protein